MSIVTFTTDFGGADGYVGAMKGVVLSRSRGATIVDLAHDIPAHDVAAGAFALAQAAPHFPAGTIHVAVVDPGVGGARADVIVVARNQLFVGPDNGLLTLAAPKPDAVFAIEAAAFRKASVSATFHGRDVFAVAAGMLAAGAPPEDAGRLLPGLEPLPQGGGGGASVIHIDRFGNAITTLPASALPTVNGRGGRARVLMGPASEEIVLEAAVARTYADVAPGAALLYVGSAGLIEVALRESSAAARFNIRRGMPVRFEVEAS